MRTPWGESDSVETVADGITVVTTASHGGMHLSPERHAAVKAKYPLFKTFAGGAWYEEDCDVAIVVATFPECFSAETAIKCAALVEADDYYRGSTDWQKA